MLVSLLLSSPIVCPDLTVAFVLVFFRAAVVHYATSDRGWSTSSVFDIRLGSYWRELPALCRSRQLLQKTCIRFQLEFQSNHIESSYCQPYSSPFSHDAHVHLSAWPLIIIITKRKRNGPVDSSDVSLKWTFFFLFLFFPLLGRSAPPTFIMYFFYPPSYSFCTFYYYLISCPRYACLVIVVFVIYQTIM